MRRIVISVVSVFCLSGQLVANQWKPSTDESTSDVKVYEQLNKQIGKLSYALKQVNEMQLHTQNDRHQLVRYSVEKVEYTDRIAEILTKQFLQKRISSDDPQRDVKLKLVHEMLIALKAIEEDRDANAIDLLAKDADELRTLIGIHEPTLSDLEETSPAQVVVADTNVEAVELAEGEEIITPADLSRIRARARAIARAKIRARARARAIARLKAGMRAQEKENASKMAEEASKAEMVAKDALKRAAEAEEVARMAKEAAAAAEIAKATALELADAARKELLELGEDTEEAEMATAQVLVVPELDPYAPVIEDTRETVLAPN